MKVSTQKSVRDQLNALLTDAYTIIDPLATPITKQDSTETIAWKTEWQRMKDMGLAPNKNFTRYKISCFLFGSDSKKTQYKPDRSVKNILETFCNRIPINDHFNIVWSETDPDHFHYHLVDVDDDEEGSMSILVSKENTAVPFRPFLFCY